MSKLVNYVRAFFIMSEVADIIYIHGVLNNNPRSFINSISQFHQTIRSKDLRVLGYQIGDGIPVFWGNSPYQRSLQYEFMSRNVFYTNKTHNPCKSDIGWKIIPADLFNLGQRGSFWLTQMARKGLYDFSFDQVWMIQNHWHNRKVLFRQIKKQIDTQKNAQRPFFIFAHSGGTVAIVKYLSEYSTNCRNNTREPNPYFENHFKGLITFGSPVSTFLSDEDIDEAANYIQNRSAAWINVVKQNDPIATVISTKQSTKIVNIVHKAKTWQNWVPIFKAHAWYWDNPKAFIQVINTSKGIASPIYPNPDQEIYEAKQKDSFQDSNQSILASKNRLTTQEVDGLIPLRIVYITRNYHETLEATKLLRRSQQIDGLHQALLDRIILNKYRIMGNPIKIMDLGGPHSAIYQPGRYERVLENIAWTNQNCIWIDREIRKEAHQVFYNQLWLLENTSDAKSKPFTGQIDKQLQDAGLLAKDETPFIIIAHGTGATALLQYLHDAFIANNPIADRLVLDRDLKGIVLLGPLANVTLNHQDVIQPVYDYLRNTNKQAFNLIECHDIFASALTNHSRPSSLTNQITQSHDQILQRSWKNKIPLIGMLPWNSDEPYWKSGKMILQLFSNGKYSPVPQI